VTFPLHCKLAKKNQKQALPQSFPMYINTYIEKSSLIPQLVRQHQLSAHKNNKINIYFYIQQERQNSPTIIKTNKTIT